MRKAWWTTCKKSHVKNSLFPDLRKIAVRNMVRQRFDITVALKITAHKTRAIFDRYNILYQEDLKQVTT